MSISLLLSMHITHSNSSGMLEDEAAAFEGLILYSTIFEGT
jgi:hypothetical protein